VLSAKADRIEAHADGAVTIVDYKTGTTPQRNMIEAGLAPQLPIEAVIAGAGGFETLPPSPIAALAYWRLTGREPAAEFGNLKVEPEALRHEAAAGLSALVAAFDDPNTPYLSAPRAEHAPRFNDYEHLARSREWAAWGDEEDV
jgi:ATP-dependent helicase/nuclease subunit B